MNINIWCYSLMFWTFPLQQVPMSYPFLALPFFILISRKKKVWFQTTVLNIFDSIPTVFTTHLHIVIYNKVSIASLEALDSKIVQ